MCNILQQISCAKANKSAFCTSSSFGDILDIHGYLGESIDACKVNEAFLLLLFSPLSSLPCPSYNFLLFLADQLLGMRLLHVGVFFDFYPPPNSDDAVSIIFCLVWTALGIF